MRRYLEFLPISDYADFMSTKAIDEVVNELKALPESDQELFLTFVKDLKQRRSAKISAHKRHGNNPAIKMIDGMLVFTGELLDQDTDWLQVIRTEREDELIRQAMGDKPTE